MSDVLPQNVGHWCQNVGHVRMSDGFSKTLKSHTVRYSPPGNSLSHTTEDFDNFDKTRPPPPPPQKKKKKKKTGKKYILRTWIIQGTWCQKELGPEQVVFNHHEMCTLLMDDPPCTIVKYYNRFSVGPLFTSQFLLPGCCDIYKHMSEVCRLEGAPYVKSNACLSAISVFLSLFFLIIS